MRIRSGIELASLSDIGCLRADNEDRYAYWEAPDQALFDRRGRLAIIADGMGGCEGGQEASRIAVETVERVYRSAPDGDPRSLLLEGFRAAHERILEQASRHPELQGMGTTCTAIVLRDGSLYYAHVGDSRLYLVRDSKIDCLTRDQSYVGRLVEQGVISAEEALSHPHRNILIMALGVGPEILPESPEQPIALEKGDALLLCTDGLWSMVNENEMQLALAGGTLEQACQDLVRLAKQRGAPDNITIQTVRTTV
jgi:serine/threonine protein phosphatase PrpC